MAAKTTPQPRSATAESTTAGRAPRRDASAAVGNHAIGKMLASAGAGELPGALFARRAVARAVPGRFPFAAQIARETGGRVDAGRVPTAIDASLPSRGVVYGGRVALRPDAGIEVARHELGHVLGGDEHIARRAERDPSVLAGLTPRAPRDGWDRDPSLRYLRLYLEDLYVDVAYDPKQRDKSDVVAEVLVDARKKAESIMSKSEIASVNWDHFAANLSQWIGLGYDGMFPLFDAFGTDDGGELEVFKGHSDGSIGQETEIRSAILEGLELKYDATLGHTPAKSERVTARDDGTVERVSSPWPLMRVSADQITDVPKDEKSSSKSKPKTDETKTVPKGITGLPGGGLIRSLTFSPEDFKRKKLRSSKRKLRVHRKPTAPKKKLGVRKRGVIELIFGPLPSEDEKAQIRRADASRIFLETVHGLWGAGGVPFGDFAVAYNKEIEKTAKRDHGMASYAIEVDDPKVLIGCMSLDADSQTGPPPPLVQAKQSIQTSVEVSVLKLGDMSDTSFLGLWDETKQNERIDREVFKAARSEANDVVDMHLRPTVAALSGGAYDESTLDMSRLKSVFTLALFQIAKAADTTRKGASPVMEKAGFGDLMREILDARDKAALWAFIKPDEPTEEMDVGFREYMLDAAERIWKVKQYLSSLEPTSTETDIDTTDPKLSEKSTKTFDRRKPALVKRLKLFASGARVSLNEQRYGTTFGRRDDDPKYRYRERDHGSRELGMRWDFRGRQRVYWKNPTNKGGTSAGKPIPLTYRHSFGRGLVHRDPRFVIEIRGGFNRINELHERLNTGQKVDRKEFDDVYGRLHEASKAPKRSLSPGPVWVPKETELPTKHDMRYPDEDQGPPTQYWPLSRDTEDSSSLLVPESAPKPSAPQPSAPMPAPTAPLGSIPPPLLGTQSMMVLPHLGMLDHTTSMGHLDPSDHVTTSGTGGTSSSLTTTSDTSTSDTSTTAPPPVVHVPPPQVPQPITHWRPHGRFQDQMLSRFVADLVLVRLRPILPTRLQVEGPQRRRLHVAISQLAGTGRYGAVANLSQPMSREFEHLVNDARVVVSRL